MERPAAAEDQVGVFRVGGRVVTHDGFFAKIVGLADGGAVSCATRAPGAPDSLLLALDVAGVGLREAVPASSVTPSSLRTVRASGSPHKRDWVALRFKGLKSVAPRPHSDSFLCARCNGAVATIDGVHKENLAPAGLSPRRLVSPRQDRPSSSAASPRRLTSPRQQDQGREELSLFGAALKKSSHLERELKTMQEAHASEMQLLIEKHEQDVRKRDQSISSRDTQIEQLKAEALEHKATLADEQRRRDAQWHELQNMRDQTEDATKTMAVLTKNLAQAVARGEELEKQVEAAKALEEDRASEMRQVRQDGEVAARRMADVVAAMRGRLREETVALGKQVEAAEQQVLEARGDAESIRLELRGVLEGRAHQVAGLKEDLSASQAVVASLEKQVEQRSQEVAAASVQYARSCDKVSKLEADLSEAMAAASGLKEDLSASQAVVASLEKQVEQRSQEVAAASHEVTRSCTQISRLEADLSEAMAAVAEAEGKIAEGGKALARKEGEMAELEGTMAELRRRWTETQEAREAEAKERKALEQESMDKARMLREAVARGEELEKQVEAAKALVREALAHGDAEREAVDKLSADIKSKEVKEEEHLKEIKTLKDELQTVREGLEESERKRQTDQKMHRTVMQRQTAEILDLKTKLDANNGKNAAACVDVDFQASIVRFQALLDDAIKTGQLSSDDLFVRTRLLGLRHKMDQLLESEHSPDEEVPFELTMCSQYL